MGILRRGLGLLLFMALCTTTYAAGKAVEETTTPGKFAGLQRFVHRGVEKAHYIIRTESAIEFTVTFCKDDVVRIQAAADGNYADPNNSLEKAQIIVDFDSRATAPKVSETAAAITFNSGKAVLVYNKADSTFELKDGKGKRLWKETKPLQFVANEEMRNFRVRKEGKVVNEKRPVTVHETVQTLSSGIEEFYYGGGQQNGYFSHKGTKIEIRADGNWNEGGHPNPAPFYMSNKGYGVLRHTFAIGAYDFTSNESIKLYHRENRFDAYYFVGDTFNRVVDLYTQFTGRPNFACIWALELGEADAYMTRDKKTKELVVKENGEPVEHTPHVISRLAEQYRKHDMPCGWILPNDGYGCGYTQLPYVVESLKKLGFYTGLWTEGDLVKTNWEVGTAGTRVQKLDVAWTGPAYQHALNCNKQAWESITRNSDSRGFVWTVQGWAGTQRYGVCWTGDQYGSWDLIRYHIPTLTGSGLSGQAYATTDVDGIFGGSPETFTRDLQWKCFTPVLYCMNGWAGKISKSPWWYDEPYRSINRRYLKLKMRMTPYMYKLCREAYDTGAPITRPMLWDYPNDKHTWGKATQYQYMLGESMIIAPVYTSMKANKGWRKEDIYLPEGQWIDYNDGRRINGPHTIDAYPVTLEKLPIFVKAGAIIPMYPEMLYNNQKPKDPLTFDIYPYGESSFELYEDDGVTRKYQQGESARQLISCKAPEGVAGDIEVTVGASVGDFDGKLETRVYQFQIHSELKPESIKFNNVTLLELSEPAAYNNVMEGWYYDKDDKRGVVHVRLGRYSTDKALKLMLDIDENLKIPASPGYPVPKVTPELDPTEFKIVTNSQVGISLNNAFDGTKETFWHSYYGKRPKKNATKFPYIIDMDLNGLYAINGFQYMARQDLGNGCIKDVEIYVSRVKGVWGKPVFKGEFKKVKEMQNIKLPLTWGKYVLLKVLSAHSGNEFATAAELNVTRDMKSVLDDEIVYLSDLKPASSKGEFKMDKSIGGRTLSVNDTEYKKGIGAKSGSELIYKLDGSWDKLTGHVGMDDEVGSKGSVMFRAYADGNLLFESPEMNGDNIKQLMALKLEGVTELRLVLLDLNDGSENDHGDWVDVKLIRTGSK